MADRYVTSSDVYGKSFTAIEMNPGHRNFMREVFVTLDWIEGLNQGQYSPSALQKFSMKGWMKLSPHYVSRWKILKKRELPEWVETGEDTVLFYRYGHRPDHVDLYYNKSLILTAGLHWE